MSWDILGCPGVIRLTAMLHKVPQGGTRYCKVAQGWLFGTTRLVKKRKVAQGKIQGNLNEDDL